MPVLSALVSSVPQHPKFFQIERIRHKVIVSTLQGTNRNMVNKKQREREREREREMDIY